MIQLPPGMMEQAAGANPGLNTMAQAYQQNTQTLGPALIQRQYQMELAKAQLAQAALYHQAQLAQTSQWHDIMKQNMERERSLEEVAKSTGKFKSMYGEHPEEFAAKAVKGQHAWFQGAPEVTGFPSLGRAGVGDVMTKYPQDIQAQLGKMYANSQLGPSLAGAPQQGGMDPIHQQLMALIQSNPNGAAIVQQAQAQGIQDPNQLMAMLQQK